jgi:hypothetical protein
MPNRPASATPAVVDPDRKAVQEQLERLLSNPHFNQSRRFPSFLRFVIEKMLDGQPDLLKERTLGIEIFGREADYDTASDPIVRVTATEIRKRIAQYYQEPGHENELRLSLPAGSYMPQFHWPSVALPAGDGSKESTLAVLPPLIEEARMETPAPVPRRGRWGTVTAFLLLGLVLVGAVVETGEHLWWHSEAHTPLDVFWGPLIHSKEPLLFCVADQSQYPVITLRDANDPTRKTLLKDDLTTIVMDDLSPVVRVAGMLQSNGKNFTLKGESATDLTDLRNGPTVFIGAFDNEWTLRLTAPLRYHFDNNATMTEFRIVDSSDPSKPGWTINRLQQMGSKSYRDFAIIARFTDSTTGKLAVVLAGVGRGGTRVAGEYLTDPADLAQLEPIAARAGNKKNMEVVLSTQIIDGEPGTPKVEASYFW